MKKGDRIRIRGEMATVVHVATPGLEQVLVTKHRVMVETDSGRTLLVTMNEALGRSCDVIDFAAARARRVA